jgi:hypothetical protein
MSTPFTAVHESGNGISRLHFTGRKAVDMAIRAHPFRYRHSRNSPLRA